jgi:hypothetical protein
MRRTRIFSCVAGKFQLGSFLVTYVLGQGPSSVNRTKLLQSNLGRRTAAPVKGHIFSQQLPGETLSD